MRGVVLRVPLDPEADCCGLPSSKNSDGSRHCCHFSLATLPALGRRGSMPRAEHMEATKSRAACVIQCIRQRQVAVQSGGDFLLKSLSPLDTLLGASMSGKVQKASWLGVEDIHEVCRVDLHTSLFGDMRENFHATPDDRAVFEIVPSSILQPKSAWCVLFGGVWRKPLDILRGEGKAYWDCVMLVGPLKVGKRFLFLLDNMALVCPESQPHVSRGLSRLSCHVHHPCLQMDRV